MNHETNTNIESKTSDHNYDDPFDISGGFYTTAGYLMVRLQTSNPTTQTGRKGQLFVQRHYLGGMPFNKAIANMLRNLADSVEFQWDKANTNQTQP